MLIREIRQGDRAEWLRLLLCLYAGSLEGDHQGVVDAYLGGSSSGYLLCSAVFVCERSDGSLCGLPELSVRNFAEGCAGATPYVESWYVEPDLRRSGIGRRLIEAAEAWSLGQGYTELASDAELGNTLSHRAHAAMGFAEEERVVHFRKDLRARPSRA